MAKTLLLVPPNSFGLPGLDFGERARCRTYEAVETRWPMIERLVQTEQMAGAIAALEALAKVMYERTYQDPQPWRPTLEQARRAVYDSIVAIARWQEDMELAIEPLERCREWDEELSSYIKDLIQQIS